MSTKAADQWRRQRSKGARSFRGQNILEPGHLDALFPKRSWWPLLVITLKTQRPPMLLRLFHCQNKAVSGQIWYNFYSLFTLLPKQSNRQGSGSFSQVISPGTPWCSATTAADRHSVNVM